METIDQNQDNQVTNMSVKDWLITLLIMIVPLVNIIMLFVWAFGGNNDNAIRKNWATAQLIFMAIVMVLYFLLFVVIFGSVMAAGSSHM